MNKVDKKLMMRSLLFSVVCPPFSLFVFFPPPRTHLFLVVILPHPSRIVHRLVVTTSMHPQRARAICLPHERVRRKTRLYALRFPPQFGRAMSFDPTLTQVSA